MPQTLLAILAMMVLSMFAFHQQRNILHSRLNMVRGETATQSTGVAIDVLEEIGTMAFDEATKDASITGSDALTNRQAFGQDAPDDDIDDFDGGAFDRYRFIGADTLRYRVSARVYYADEDDPEEVIATAGVQTKYKKVTVKVYNLDVQMPDTVTLSQTFSCGSRCDW